MKKIKIGIIVGSLRKDSLCKKTARALAALMPENFEMAFIEIGNLSLYNQDFEDEGKTPPEWTAFRNQIAQMDGFIFVTPEYNRSYSAAIKNALDIASRPYGQNKWNEKYGMLVGVTIGKLGALASCVALRQVFSFLNIRLMMQPEAYLSEAQLAFNDEGEVIQNGVRQFLQDLANSFADTMMRVKKS